jgi:CheY-like chemotaxis protein
LVLVGACALRTLAGACEALSLARVALSAGALDVTLDRAALAAMRPTILVVDDDRAVRELLRTFLLDRGYTVIAAASGREALRLSHAHRGKIDLLLTDVVMPGMNGPELVEQFASLRPETQVLYVSGSATATPDRDGAALGEPRLLLKPFSSDELARNVHAPLVGDRLQLQMV